MIKKTITYTGFDNHEHTGDFYFHLSTAELMDIEANQEGGMGNFLEKIVKSGDAGKIIKEFKRIISMAYGERMDDGSFEKDDRSTDKFMRSPAFDALFLELVTSPEAASEFINGIIPKDLVRKLGTVTDAQPAGKKRIQDMSKEELIQAWGERDAQRAASQE